MGCNVGSWGWVRVERGVSRGSGQESVAVGVRVGRIGGSGHRG